MIHTLQEIFEVLKRLILFDNLFLGGTRPLLNNLLFQPLGELETLNEILPREFVRMLYIKFFADISLALKLVTFHLD